MTGFISGIVCLAVYLLKQVVGNRRRCRYGYMAIPSHHEDRPIRDFLSNLNGGNAQASRLRFW